MLSIKKAKSVLRSVAFFAVPILGMAAFGQNDILAGAKLREAATEAARNNASQACPQQLFGNDVHLDPNKAAPETTPFNQPSIRPLMGQDIKLDPNKPAQGNLPFEHIVQPPLLETGETQLGKETEVPKLIKKTLDDLAAQKKPVLLKCTIEHQEHLPSVPDGYRTGQTVNVKELQNSAGENFWRKIPKELGGTWVSEDDLHFKTKELKDVTVNGKKVLVAGREDLNFKKSRAYKRAIVGFQLDRQGNEWTYEGGLTETIQGTGFIIVDMFTKREIYYESKDSTFLELHPPA